MVESQLFARAGELLSSTFNLSSEEILALLLHIFRNSVGIQRMERTSSCEAEGGQESCPHVDGKKKKPKKKNKKKRRRIPLRR